MNRIKQIGMTINKPPHIDNINITNNFFYRRKNAKYPGGPLLDCGIHYVAALRHLLSAASQTITHVSAFTCQLQPHLSPLDTMHSTLLLQNTHSGTLSISFGAEFRNAFEFIVVTTTGAVAVTPTVVSVLTKDPSNGEKSERQYKFPPMDSHAVQKEVASFAKAIATGKMEQRASPEEASEDLKLLQTMLESGEDGGAVKAVR